MRVMQVWDARCLENECPWSALGMDLSQALVKLSNLSEDIEKWVGEA